MLLGRVPGAVVVLAPGGVAAGVDTRGAPVGTRELDLLDPSALVQRVHAVTLSESPSAPNGVMRWLAERGHGFPVDGGVVPIVCGAAVGDLREDVGHAACEAAVEVAVPPAVVLVGQTAAAFVVVDADLDKAGCRRVAMSAQDGLVRAGLRVPSTVFALATGVATGTPLDELCTTAAKDVFSALR
ncbi:MULTISPECIES: peptidase S58, DmpA [unclassified Saccharothrix]|uniref:peptidase S58, DmpA n=1 Tax=unclassified Saccharothrix TaxID=2593673 RepID=UPI00307E2E48